MSRASTGITGPADPQRPALSYVVVVEDDPPGAAHGRHYLSSFGHRVRVVPDPATAAQVMVWSRPRVVLADRSLPSHDDHVLRDACERLAVPLLDLASTICLMGQTEHRAEHAVSGQPEPVG